MVLDSVDDPANIEEHKAYHRNVCPEVKEGFCEISIEEMRILLSGNRLFMFLRAGDDFDLAKDFQTYTDSSPKAGEWDILIRTYQQKVPTSKEGEGWAPMEEVFSLDG